MPHLDKLGSVLLLLLFAPAAFAFEYIIVGFSPAVSSPERHRIIESVGGRISREFHLVNAVAAELPENMSYADVLALKGVLSIEADRKFKWVDEFTAAPMLPALDDVLAKIKEHSSAPSSQLWHESKAAALEEIPWGVKRVNAAAVWHVTTGQAVKVAVLDTGIDYSHPDLRANYAGGYNAMLPSTSTIDALDDNGHGTHVAGTIAALQDGEGVVGVAPNARLFGVKVLDYDGTGRLSWIISGIEWATDNQMAVINMSLGGPYPSDILAQTISAAYNKGVTIVCSAGNTSDSVNYPARYPEAIAVSALDRSDKIAQFSSRGPEIAFIAPGVEVPSTYLEGLYVTKSGTSMAAPHVTGLAALAISLGANTPQKVKDSLAKAAVKLDLLPSEQGAGLIDSAKLLESLH